MRHNGASILKKYVHVLDFGTGLSTIENANTMNFILDSSPGR